MNFDNIFTALTTLFVLSTIEGWPNYVFVFVDGGSTDPVTDIYRGPIKNNYRYFYLS